MDHYSCLLKVCPLCGIKLPTSSRRNPKVVTDYTDIITSLFNVDVSKQMHPDGNTCLCDTCRRYLDKAKENPSGYDVEGSLFVAPIHADNCAVCDQFKAFGGKQKFQRPFSLTAKKQDASLQHLSFFDCLDQIAHRYGFWSFHTSSNAFAHYGLMDFTKAPRVTLSVQVTISGSWSLHAFSKDISSSMKCAELPEIVTRDNAQKFFKFLTHDVRICPANADFEDVIKHKLEFGGSQSYTFLGKDSQPIMEIETSDMQQVSSANVVRAISCERLVLWSQARCRECEKYRGNLYGIRHRMKKDEEAVDEDSDQVPMGPSKFMSRELMQRKLNITTKNIRDLRRSVDTLKGKIKSMIELDGQELDDSISVELAKTAAQSNPCDIMPENSPQRLLWEQQVAQMSLKDKRSMRWHPLMIRWCLSLYLKSPGAYKQLAASGFLALPHSSTLAKYINFTEPGCGFNADVVQKLFDDTGMTNLPDFKKNVTLVFDEIKIKSGLVYSRGFGRMIGFTDLGSLNNELAEFNRSVESGDSEKNNNQDLATFVMCFMVRGIFLHLASPFGYFASTGFTSDQLFPCVWEAVRVLTSTGFYVKCFVCDGASPNRKFYKLHRLPDGENESKEMVVYWALNRYSPEEKIYFICDVPHLIKTTRNNWENSHANRNTRNLMYNGKQISWQHLVQVVEGDLYLNPNVLGLRRLHKLTHEHLHLNPRLRMKVNLAAQVLSASVANLLDLRDNPETESTRAFIRNMDQFFDCLNVTTRNQWQKKGKAALKEYTSVDDWRFKWLSETFLEGFLGNWESECQMQQGLSREERNRLCLSKQTLEGIRITVRSFVELAKTLLGLEGVEFLLSEKFTQDPIEEHFSRQRLKGGCNENPTLANYGMNELALNVAGSSMIRVLTGNTKGRVRNAPVIDVNDERCLKKKSKR